MLILPAQLESYRSLKDKTLKVTFETNELNPQETLSVIEGTGKFGYLAFKIEPFRSDEKEMLHNLKTDFDDKTKSSSQRLRNVFYLMWKKDPEGFETSVQHYEHQMEKLLNHFKSKLD